MTTAVVWFRRDLRLDDNPAWADATATADAVCPLYVIDPALFEPAGEHRRRALLGYLGSLDGELRGRGGRLRVECGRPADVVPRVAASVGAASIHLNADTTPYSRRRDAAVGHALGDGVGWHDHWGTLVCRPGSITTTSGSVSRVFTPFFRRWNATEWDDRPEGGEASITADPGDGVPDGGDDSFSERAALDRLAEFDGFVDDYPDGRDRLADDATSQLSTALRWGAISPRRVATEIGGGTPGREAFVRQLAWRDWYAHLLVELPDLRTRAMKPDHEIAWIRDDHGTAAWRDGRTGYPVVDAGMRQLARTGWMHNRARMITASFLCKDLLVDWRLGERWFFDQLADGDVAQNAGNWQWVAGTGPDAAPYFRIFNPVTQSRRFDPDGDYIRRWVPELADVPTQWIHAPWEAPPLELAAAGVVLGDDYPAPIVDHAAARDRALAAYQATR